MTAVSQQAHQANVTSIHLTTSNTAKKNLVPCWMFGLFMVANCNTVFGQSTPTPTQDATSQSSRERDRILLKRSPIASEYQSLRAPGEVFGASFDAEGVDFRSQFGLSQGQTKISQIKVEGNLNYQSLSEKTVLGGSIKAAKSFGKLSLQLQAQKNSSERLVDHYESRWLISDEASSAYGQEVQTLSYPRYTQDQFQTESINTRWRADYQVNDALLITYEGINTNYDDIATRNRFEVQLGAGEISDAILNKDGDTITDATVTSAKIRRYFHRTDTARDFNRHKLGFTLDRDEGSLEVNSYYSRWVNDKVWKPWNFIDSNVSATYNINDRYLPQVDITNSDIYDVTNAIFSNYRIVKTVTTDTDYAFLVNWDQKFHMANRELWVEAGGIWRNKERAVDNSSAVYGATSDSFNLSALTGQRGNINILNNEYLLPAGIGTNNGNSYFSAHQNDQFELNLSQSFIETIQDIYTSEETVSSVYINAYQQRDHWFWRAGLRFEKTETATRGAVYDAPDSDIGSTGQAITSVKLNGEVIEETFDSFDAAFVTGGNNYQHLLPSLELRYNLNEQVTLKTAYFQQLMRPQYFDTVSYKRANIATLSITEGNPDLEATTIQNLYAGLEYRYSNTGQLFAGVYYNSVSDFFYDSSTTEVIDGDVYEVASVENGKDGYIKGLQTYWAHQIALPMGADAELKLAYTYSDSEATLSDRKITMPERADHRVAFHLVLGKDAWQYNSQFSWQSEAVDDVGATASQDTIREKVLVWDQSVTWQYNKQLLTRFSLNNVLDYPERSYQGESNRVLNNLYSGSTARLSVAYTY
jgi:TonB-dependent receptor